MAKRYSQEFKDRAVRMLLDRLAGDGSCSQWQAVREIAPEREFVSNLWVVTDVAFDLAEALSPGFLLATELLDFSVVATDEVPPHDDALFEGFATDKEHSRGGTFRYSRCRVGSCRRQCMRGVRARR